MASLTSLLLVSSLFLSSFFCVSEAQSSAPVVQGLSWNFYESSCPKVDDIVRKQLKKVFKADIGQAAGLLRLHFHDCFVQGCDGSVLLEGSASGPSEQDAPPNLSLRAKAFEIINDLRDRVHKKCGRVVSCSDIVALAARDSVFLMFLTEADTFPVVLIEQPTAFNVLKYLTIDPRELLLYMVQYSWL